MSFLSKRFSCNKRKYIYPINTIHYQHYNAVILSGAFPREDLIFYYLKKYEMRLPRRRGRSSQ